MQAQAPATHWLLFDHPPHPSEVEALVVSREMGVAWVDHRTLGWQPGVMLMGPLTDDERAGEGDLPEWVHSVYTAITPRERGPAIPPELLIPGSILAAFPDGEPTGVERAAVETLEAIARRLGGAVLAETGQIVVPEPRIDLVLFSAEWIEEADLIALLEGLAPFHGDAGPVLPPSIQTEGYGLVAEDGTGVLSVTASPADLLPASLQGYDWASGEVFVYEFRHYPTQTFGFAAPLPSTPHDAEGAVDHTAAAAVEAIAATVLSAAGGQARGHLCDDDGFLVTLD